MARLISVNVGKPEPIPGKTALTGIYKRPVEGPVAIDEQGLKHDAILDRKHHGGVDQAVYIYFADDYQWWADELGQRIEPGLFGENLTVEGVIGREAAVGDRYQIGDVVVEVTSHRTPCMVFALRMGDPKFLKRFHKSGRSGAYCRVIVPGEVTAGMELVETRHNGERITVSDLMALDGARTIPTEFMQRALTTPVHYKLRAEYEHKLATLF